MAESDVDVPLACVGSSLACVGSSGMEMVGSGALHSSMLCGMPLSLTETGGGAARGADSPDNYA